MTGRMFGGTPPILITISSNQVVFNIRTAAGNPSAPVLVVVTILAGVLVTGMTTGSGWAAGSKINIVNHGRLSGSGGAGGFGGNGVTHVQPTAGQAGFDALTLGYSVTIDNTDGEIFGGGGGGGGGCQTDVFSHGGGGGGGGQGHSGGTGAPGGANGGGTGVSGSTTTPGTGGAGNLTAGGGGAGGWFGEAGHQGSPNSVGSSGAVGGAAGKAIALNGFTATIIAGGDATRVKG